MKRVCKEYARGQASMEYVVVCAALAIALGVAMTNQDSAMWQLADAFKTAFRKFSYALSLPG